MKIEGIVKFFDIKKGYGFINHQNVDYFVHYKSILMTGFKELHQNDLVMFAPVKSEKGWTATDVMLINDDVRS